MDVTYPEAKNMYWPSDKHLEEPYVTQAPAAYFHNWLACFDDCDFGADSEEEANDIMAKEKIARQLQVL